MLNVLIVGIGGFFGAAFRYMMSGFIHNSISKTLLPYTTLSVNVLGCLLIGFLGGLIETKGIFNQESRLLVLAGFLGGFTTFSAFGLETFTSAREGHLGSTIANVVFHLVFCLGAVWMGNSLSRQV